MSSNKGLLRLTMRSGHIGYPVFQFQAGRQIEGLGAIVRLLRPAVATEWTIASWLTSPNVDLGGDTPVEGLRSHRRVEAVTTAARRFEQALAA